MPSYRELACFRRSSGKLLLLAALLTVALTAQEPTPATDRLAVEVWQAMVANDPSRMVSAAQQLLAIDRNHALALAAVASAGEGNVMSAGKRGLRNANRLQKPAGMSEEEFALLKKEVLVRLNGAVGAAYVARQDHVTARRYLNNAIALAPAHTQYVYAAAMANLEGANPRRELGYRLLARAVHLSAATPEGEELAQFARDHYVGAGGSEEDWEAYLAASKPSLSTDAQVARQATARERERARADADVPPHGTERTEAPTPTEAEAATDPKAAEGKPAEEVADTSGAVTAQQPEQPRKQSEPGDEKGGEAPAESRRKTGSSRADEAGEGRETPPPIPGVEEERRQMELAKNTEPRIFPELSEPMPPVEPGTPISLGIVIQSRLGHERNRVALANGLSRLVRQMREGDEAFVISFSRGMVFEQDFTGNYELLEQALESIEAESGAAMMQSVAFAAVHLARVARNSERVLLVISDGESSEVLRPEARIGETIEASGARIFCIGVGVELRNGRERLRRLASATGGEAVFISGPREFRAAAQKIAAALKIAEPVQKSRR